MRYVRLGKTDLEVSVLSLGTWAFGGEWGSFSELEARGAIESALEHGITLFDTAQAYGFGISERLLGDALWKRARRDDVIVATKGGLRMDGTTLVRDASPEWLRKGVESSLTNLDTDHIDLYQVHWPDDKASAEQTGEELARLVEKGEIRHVGVSNYNAAEMEALSQYCAVETLQPPYHMFRRSIEAEILPYISSHDIGVLAYGPLAHGLLSGAMTAATNFAPDDWRSHSSDFSGETFHRNLKVVGRLNHYAREIGLPLVQLAVAWIINNPSIEVAIVGARRPSQLESILPAAEVQLTEEDMAAIDAILADALPVRGPSPEGM